MERFVIRPLIFVSLALALLLFLVSCSGHTAGQPGSSPQLVELLPIELDSRNPQQKEFGRLEFLNGFELRSRDPRFGGLSGLTIGADGRLYAVSDAGYWVSAQMIVDSEARLLDLSRLGYPTASVHDRRSGNRPAPRCRSFGSRSRWFLHGSFRESPSNLALSPAAGDFLLFTLTGSLPRGNIEGAEQRWTGGDCRFLGWSPAGFDRGVPESGWELQRLADRRRAIFRAFLFAFRGISSNGLRRIEQRRCDCSRAPLRSARHSVSSAEIGPGERLFNRDPSSSARN